jgi:DNA (cytosine-5)-methyltransferase 1
VVVSTPVAHVDVMPTMRSGQSNGGPSHGQVSGDTRDEYIVPVTAHAFDGRQSDVIQYGDVSGPLDTDRSTVCVMTESVAFKASHYTRGKDGAPSTIAPPLSADADKGDQDTLVVAYTAIPEVAETLRAGGNRTGGDRPPGTDVDTAGTYLLPVEVTEPLVFDTTQVTHPANRSNPQPGDPCHPLAAQGDPPAIAFAVRGREEGAVPEVEDDGSVTSALRAASGGSSRDYVALPDVKAFTVSDQANGFAWESDVNPSLIAHRQSDTSGLQYGLRVNTAVRRLTPTECERLQGFPDGHTAISYNGKPAADGPRYKALGNSMAVPVMAFIGRRIQEVEDLIQSGRI